MIVALVVSAICLGGTVGFITCAVMMSGACDEDCERARREGYRAGYDAGFRDAGRAVPERPFGRRLAVVGGSQARS